MRLIGGILLSMTACATLRPDAKPPTLRLPHGVHPERMAVDLELDPAQTSGGGVVDIDLRLDAPTDAIWLRVHDLQIHSAVVDGQAAPITVDNDFLGLHGHWAAGRVHATIHFTARFSTVDTTGIFRQEAQGDRYLFTQFETLFARRAFPCFDEPAFKIPWSLTLRVPPELTALANSPVDSSRIEGGRKVVRFAETPPLPSYLIAFAVGPLVAVDAGPSGRNRTPVHIYAPRSEAGGAGYAARILPQVLTRLEDYFDQAYPYAKLDCVAIPITVGFGAMENPGLVTFGSRYLMIAPEDESPGRRRRLAGYVTHELAHMWFGDEVTLAWWDDVWLNESLANWLAVKILAEWDPQMEWAMTAVEARNQLVVADALPTARSIRRPIETEDDIIAMDSSMAKGQSVLEMFEAWIGADATRAAIRRYVAKNAHKNASFVEFLAELGPRPTGEAYETFLEQPGLPLVTMKVTCDAVELTQERFRIAGATDEGLWRIPICVRYPAQDGSVRRACTLLDGKRGTLPLPGAHCASGVPWLIANAGGTGAYVSRSSVGLGPAATAAERLADLGDRVALVGTGQTPAGELVASLPARVKEGDARVTALTARFVADIGRSRVTPAARPGYQKLVTALYAPIATRLGTAPLGTDTDADATLRPLVVDLVTRNGGAPALVDEARRKTDRWLADRSGIVDDMLPTVLAIAARAGDAALFDRMVSALRTAGELRHRTALIQALREFLAPELVARSFALLLDEKLDPRETGGLLDRPIETAEATYDFVVKHFAELVARLPELEQAGLVRVAGALCDPSTRADAEAFFTPRVAGLTGGSRRLTLTLAKMDQCIALAAAQRGEIESALQALGP